jgi:hypothetical protein
VARIGQEVERELEKESDRGCVVLAFAWMDEQITINLRRYLLPSDKDSEKSDELLGPIKPLGDASTKINLCCRLGIITPQTRDSLHLMRRLRNEFAHISSPLTFDTPSVRSRILAIVELERNILEPFWFITVPNEGVDFDFEKTRGKSNYEILRNVIETRRLFIACAALLVGQLILMSDMLVPVKSRFSVAV